MEEENGYFVDVFVAHLYNSEREVKNIFYYSCPFDTLVN